MKWQTARLAPGRTVLRRIGFFNNGKSDLNQVPSIVWGSALWLEQREYEPIGEILSEVRQEAGFTQQELAKRLRKPQSFVSSYESGQRRIDILEFLKIMDLIGADPMKIFVRITNAVATKPKAKRR